MKARGLPLPQFQPSSDQSACATENLGDFATVARLLTPIEAYLLASCLESCEIPALVSDVNFVQMYSLLGDAVGGVSVRVPRAYVTEAREVIAAFRRGEFQLDEGFDQDGNCISGLG